jgi:hypothetical protein
MSKKMEGTPNEWAKHLRKEGKRVASKAYRKFLKSELRKV